MFGKPQISPELLMGLGGGILSGPNLASGLGAGFQQASNIMTVQRQEQQIKEGENKTRDFVQRMFPNEDVANMPPEVLKTFASEAIKQKFADPKKPNLMNVGNGLIYDADSKQWIQPPADMMQSRQPELGLNPQYGVDAQGNPVLLQLSKDGRVVQPKLPDGVQLSKEPIKLDAGTHFVLLDPITRQPVGTIPKDVAGQVEQEALGKEVGAIKAALPSARTTAKIVSDQIQQIKNDTSLPDALGSIDSNLPTIFPGTARVESRIDMLTGQSFLQAREMLRGGGQITDYEGKRAEAAMARLNRSQSPEDFKAALDEFNSAVQDGLKKLEAVANGNLDYGKQPQQPAANPNVESLIEKYRTK